MADAYQDWLDSIAAGAKKPIASESPSPVPVGNETAEAAASPIWTVLDYINRPFSSIMGGIHGIVKGEDWTKNVEDALAGKKSFSSRNLLVDVGAPEDSALTTIGGIALDIFPGSLIDPVSYLTFGTSKLGKVAKIGAEIGQVADEAALAGREGIALRKIADPITQGLERYAVDYGQAAAKGQWSPLNVLGVPVVPKAIAEPLGKARQAIGDFFTGTVATETAAGRTVATSAEEMGRIKSAVSSPYRTAAKYLGGSKSKFGDVWPEFMAQKQAIFGKAAEDLTVLDDVLKDADPAAQELVTHLIEEPGLAQALSEGRQIRVAVPKGWSDEDTRKVADTLLPYLKAGQDAKTSYATEFKAGLYAMRDTLDTVEPREYDAVTLGELKQLGSGQDLDAALSVSDPLRAMYDEPATGDALIKAVLGPNASFEGLRPLKFAQASKNDPRNQVLKMLKHERDGKGRMGFQNADELLGQNDDAVILFSKPGAGRIDDAMRSDLRGAGGYSRDWQQRKETIFRTLDKLQNYRGDLQDFDTVAKAIGENGATLEHVWNAVNNDVWKRAPGLHTDYADKLVRWNIAQMTGDPVAEWKFKQNAIGEEIGKRVAELDALRLAQSGIPDAPVDVLKTSKQLQLLDEIDKLKEDLGSTERFGKAEYFRQLLEDKGRPRIAPPTEDVVVDPQKWSPQAQEFAMDAVEKIQPIRQAIFDLYTSRGLKPPNTTTYMQHIMSGQAKGWNPAKTAAEQLGNDEKIRQALYTSFAMDNPTLRNEDIAKRVEIEMQKLRGAYGSRISNGKFDPLVFRRKWPFTILQINESPLNFTLEANAGKILGEEYRIASNWAYGYDAYNTLTTKWAGKYAKQFASAADAPRGWVKIDYHVPFVEKNPFDGWYIPKQLDEAMRKGMGAAKFFSSENGMNALVDNLHGFRRIWSAWTLGPFPAYHARNAVSNMMLSYVGGLDPLSPSGARAYAAGMSVWSEKRLQKGLTDQASILSKLYGNPEITADKLTDTMKTNGIIGVGLRDLDWEKKGDEILEQVKKNRGNLSDKAKDFAKYLLHPNPQKNAVVRFGFDVGKRIEDTSRAALFMNRLEQIAPHAKDWETAVKDATYWTNKHLYDYGDLTPTEQTLKAFIPFYTFSSKNIPHMLETMVTDPKRLNYLNRAYQGAWNGFDKQLEDEDLPDWLAEDMAMPIDRFKNEKGQWEYRVWSPTGFMPMSEVNELAQSFRDRKSFARFWVSKLNPLLKEPLEQIMDRDTFSWTEITKDGQQRDLFGLIKGPAWMMHVAQNIRLVNELDRINPGGLFTEWGKDMGWWKGERPHRNEAPQPDRIGRFFTGLNIKAVEPIEELQKKVLKLENDANKLKSLGRRSMRDGNISEAQSYQDEYKQKIAEIAVYQKRIRDGAQYRATH